MSICLRSFLDLFQLLAQQGCQGGLRIDQFRQYFGFGSLLHEMENLNRVLNVCASLAVAVLALSRRHAGQDLAGAGGSEYILSVFY